MSPAASAEPFAIARALIESGQLDAAEKQFQRVLANDPAQPEALEFVIKRAAEREDFSSIVAVIEGAMAAGMEDAELFRVLGQARFNGGDAVGAQSAFERSLALAPEQFQLWLNLGHLREAAGQAYQALIAYFRAVTTAQNQGRWLNEETTAPALRQQVKHAMAFIDDGRERLFSDAIEPLRRRHGAAALARIEHCLAIYLGHEVAVYNHPLQRPTFLYFPGLPAAGFYPRNLFPWMDELEANTASIRQEAQAVLAADNVLEPFLGAGSETGSGQLRNDRGKPVWDAFFFYRHGNRFDKNCERCPVTASVLERSPLVRIDEHAPEILFSVLTPGSHILPHTGVTNARLVAHLPLIVPPDCAIRVGEEQRGWEEGRGFVFDDTYEHEAWNHGDETRVVLIMDAWNPYLTEVERGAAHDLVLAIGAFNRACGIH